MPHFSNSQKNFNTFCVLLFLITLANLGSCHDAASDSLDDQFDERFRFRPSSCSYSMRCSKRPMEEDSSMGAYPGLGTGRSGPGVGRSGPGISRSGPGVGRSGPGIGRSGPGVGRSGPGVGRSGPGDGRSGPGVGRSGPGIGRSGPGVGRSGLGVGRSGPGISRSGPGVERSEAEFGLDQESDTATHESRNGTTNARGRRELTKLHPSTDESPNEPHQRLPCYCDEDCSLYGDCCTDGPLPPSDIGRDGNTTAGDGKSSRDDKSSSGHGNTSTGHGRNVGTSRKKSVGSVTTDSFSCDLLHPDQPQFEHKGVYMVSRCPSDASPFLARKCHKDVEDRKYHYMMDVPVVSKTTELIYANIFCAYCHDDQPIVRYNHSIVCNCDLKSKKELKTMTYERGNRTWIEPLSDERNCVIGSKVTGCILNVHYPTNIGRHCEYQLIDKCANDWDVHGDRVMCQSTNYYVHDAFSSVYKNPACAKCNHVPLDTIRCFAPQMYKRFGPDVGGNVFKLSDLFDTNHECTEDDAVDIIFEECLQIYEQSEKSTTVFDIIYIVLMSLSLIAMLLHMAIFILLFAQRNLHTKNLFSMTCCLFGAEFLLLICSRECKSTVGCYISTVIVYYLFMSSFFWMNVMSYDVCKTFRSTQIRSNSHRSYIKYAVYAFCLPALMAATAIIVDFSAPHSVVSPGFGSFWFSERGGLLLFFIGPALVIFVANVAMLAVSMYDIYTHQKSTKFGSAAIRKSKAGSEAKSFLKKPTPVTLKEDEPITEASKLNQIHGKIKENLDKIKVDKARLVLYSKLALIMGAPWFFALFDNVSVVCQYIFNILNSLQGILIFVAFDCKSKVLVSVCEKFGWQKAAEYFGSSSGTTSGGSSVGTKRRVINKTSSAVATSSTS